MAIFDDDSRARVDSIRYESGTKEVKIGCRGAVDQVMRKYSSLDRV